jgi:hypothetical protein
MDFIVQTEYITEVINPPSLSGYKKGHIKCLWSMSLGAISEA